MGASIWHWMRPPRFWRSFDLVCHRRCGACGSITGARPCWSSRGGDSHANHRGHRCYADHGRRGLPLRIWSRRFGCCKQLVERRAQGAQKRARERSFSLVWQLHLEDCERPREGLQSTPASGSPFVNVVVTVVCKAFHWTQVEISLPADRQRYPWWNREAHRRAG